MNDILFNKLINRIQYDTKAFDKLYCFYYDRIVNLLQFTYGFSMAEEVAQDFFMKLIMGKIKFDYIKYPTSWVYKCCENLAKRKIYYDSRENEVLADEIIDYDAINLFEERENLIVLEEVLKVLDEDSQKIIILHYWWRYNLKEIAEILHLNFGTVRTRHRRALFKIKKSLIKEI